MGFYYGSNQPPEEDERGSWKDVLYITLAAFKVLAVPFVLIVAIGAYIFFVFYMFSLSPFAGYASLSLVAFVLAGIWAWEKSHPPKLEG